MSSLSGKVVIVTGAGGGLGRAYSRYLAKLGTRVVVNDIDAEAASETVSLISADGGEGFARPGDISTWAFAEELTETAVTTWGRLDGLVNNAGVFAMASIDETNEQHWRTTVDVNLLGTAYCGTHALRVMIRQGSGAIVNVTSGTQAGSPFLAAYAATKGAIASMTYSWAMETSGTAVRVNAISPNAHTRMADEFERYLGDRAPAQNVGKSPMTNAPIVAFLLADESMGITGQVLRVDADQVGLMSHPAIVTPTARRDSWDVTTLESNWRQHLQHQVQPLGLTTTNWPVSADG